MLLLMMMMLMFFCVNNDAADDDEDEENEVEDDIALVYGSLAHLCSGCNLRPFFSVNFISSVITFRRQR